jgi:hypothetical protein
MSTLPEEPSSNCLKENLKKNRKLWKAYNAGWQWGAPGRKFDAVLTLG